MSAALLTVALLAIGLWLATRLGGCAHVDEHGRSVLVWTVRAGRVCGWCPHCFRLTRGWSLTNGDPTR